MKYTVLLLASAISLMSCQSSTSQENQNNTETQENNAAATTGYKIGDEATDFSLKNVDGEMVSLADYPDSKGYIVIFTCNHCPYSIAYEDRIIALQDAYGPQGYPVIAINPNDPVAQPDDSYEKMQERASEKNFNFPYLFDEGQQIYPQYGATRTPHVFILQKEDGKNIVRYIGAIDNNHEDANDVSEHYVQDAMEALIAGTTVDPAETRAIGCSIKTQ